MSGTDLKAPRARAGGIKNSESRRHAPGLTEVRLRRRYIGNPTSFVFWNARYKRGYKYKVLNKAWKKTGSSVELYEATRHSLATQLMDAGEPLKRVQGVMRHADARTTLKYQHAGDENTRQALNRRGKGNVIVLKKDVGET